MRSALLSLSLTEPKIPAPIFPGDHPDPTIIRVGQHFWACATSSEWSPQFPLFRSPDLLHWTPAGAVFPQQPAWAEGAFWAPELVHDHGRFLLYYVARARGGPLSIAVASASHPEGPWHDHGPILAESLGSIDPCFARDEHGQPFLIWKTDGNSRNLPTPIWAQPLTPDLLRLTGAPTLLITNDQPWEEGVVEGPYILRHAHRFYLFYAGNTCCGQDCKYAEGVARADRLLGPYTKSPHNPLIHANAHWRCPGHGTAVHGHRMHGRHGQDYLLYHAYPESGGDLAGIYVGRQAVLDRISWTPDGWPSINAGQGPHGNPDDSTPVDFIDDFALPTLHPAWQWPVNTQPEIGFSQRSTQALRVNTQPEFGFSHESTPALRVNTQPEFGFSHESTPALRVNTQPEFGFSHESTQALRVNTQPESAIAAPRLTLRIPTARQSAMLALPVPGGPAATASVVLSTQVAETLPDIPECPQPPTPSLNTPPTSSWSGLAVVGDPFNTIGLGLRQLPDRSQHLEVWVRRGDYEHIAWSRPAPPSIIRLHLRVHSLHHAELRFSYSLDDAATWHDAGDPVDASDLPAWDRALRIALMLEGPAHTVAAFQHFTLQAR